MPTNKRTSKYFFREKKTYNTNFLTTKHTKYKNFYKKNNIYLDKNKSKEIFTHEVGTATILVRWIKMYYYS